MESHLLSPESSLVASRGLREGFATVEDSTSVQTSGSLQSGGPSCSGSTGSQLFSSVKAPAVPPAYCPQVRQETQASQVGFGT